MLSTLKGIAQQHAFSVKDDIGMVRFNDPSADLDATENDSEAYSPDGKHVAIITTQGLLASDQVRSVISVFDLDELNSFLASPSSRSPIPRSVASVEAISQGQQTIPYAAIIHDLRWSDDSKHIIFRGQNKKGGYQLYEARTYGGECRILTPITDDVDHFDIAGNTIAYTATPLSSPPPPPGIPINRDAFDATGFRSSQILFPGEIRSFEVKTLSLFTLGIGDHPRPRRRVPGYSVQDTTFFHYLFPFRLSPDGRWLISVEPVTGSIPAYWQDFDPLTPFEHRRLRAGDPDLTRPDNVLRSRRYTLINLWTGASRILVNAPSAEFLGYVSDANRVVWSKDRKRVLLTNLYFPPDTLSGREVSHPMPCVVASIDLPSLERRCLYFNGVPMPWSAEHVANVGFGKNRGDVFVTLRSASGERNIVGFQFVNGEWSPDSLRNRSTAQTADSETRQHGGVRVYVKQDLNQLPTLWASDSQTKNRRQLWNPNPQLAHVAFGQVSVFRWRDSSGRDWIGGLVKPVGYIPGHRYPLVIQMYVFREHEFLTDGTDPSAFAARHLASAGMVVLQIRKQPNVLSDQDASTSLDGYESAIRQLSNDGLIDSRKVGVVGFSWTCWYAINALIKAPKLFAAATIADGLDNSYAQYIFGAPSQPNLQAQMNQIRGGSPFGPNLERWVKEAPGFHLDQVQTPVRIEANDPDAILQEWELYGGLYLQHKPVDLIYFPEGTHIHQRPLERLESQQGNVDWMRFWLQGYEDPDPAKCAEYQRWKKMRSAMDGEPSAARFESNSRVNP
jgi:dipeptidyl aminopeptidase/acylaminoacyl peptidase